MKYIRTFFALIALAIGSTCSRNGNRKPNVLWILLDDISTERYPESGNDALKGLLPGIEELKNDGAVYYPHFYSPSSQCAPSQVSLFSGMEPGNIGGQYQFAGDILEGKANYQTVPPPEVIFMPEKLRELGYWSTGAGKLDYQVADVIPTLYNQITGGFLSDITSDEVLNSAWGPALKQNRPFFGMFNMMDHHQFLSSMQREAPIPITDPMTGNMTTELPFGRFGYAKPTSITYKTSTRGTFSAPAAGVDYAEADIVGYTGSLDETLLTHANGGVPGYLPEEIGIQSILAREYDLIRNADYRLKKIIRKMKADGVYDDTLIMFFGDHGSGLFKAKALLQPQSVRTPLWIKYPKGTRLPDAVHKNGDDHNIDERMAGIIDLFPTTLSVIGVEPLPYLEGRALAGDFLDTRPERDIMFALLSRVSSKQAWKTFSAFSKEFYYQENWLHKDALEDRASLDIEGELAMITDAMVDSKYTSHMNFFAKAPIFERLQKLMRVNALNATYKTKYYALTADEQRPPPQCLFDLRSDSDGTKNLLHEYTYNIGMGSTIEKWGNKVKNVTVEYGPLDETGLDDSQSSALAKLRSSLSSWIDSQKWVANKVDWTDSLFGEENKMGEVFWPGGIQPQTAAPFFSKPRAINEREDIALVELSSLTPGTVFRHAAVISADLEKCEQIGSGIKKLMPEMSILSSGLPAIEYTSMRNGLKYMGYYYGVDVNRKIVLNWFIGQYNDCSMFVSSDGTFLELVCPLLGNVWIFDTRDSTWNGTTWVDLDMNGGWIGTPITFWDASLKKLNVAAFNEYIFGSSRNEIYSGLDENGAPLASYLPHYTPLNKGHNPAPKYWALPVEDVTVMPVPIYPGAQVTPFGWHLDSFKSSFKSVSTDGLNDVGSFSITLKQRTANPQLFATISMSFNSFDYECLLWDVGSTVSAPVLESQKTHVFVQGTRKGYADTSFAEYVFETNDVIHSTNESKLENDVPFGADDGVSNTSPSGNSQAPTPFPVTNAAPTAVLQIEPPTSLSETSTAPTAALNVERSAFAVIAGVLSALWIYCF